MYHVLLIRPLEDALSMALELKAKGIESSHCPLFQPQFLPLPPLENSQALIITSKNGIRALVQKPFEFTHSVSFPRKQESIKPLDPRLGGDDNLNKQYDGGSVPEAHEALKKIPLYAVGDKTAEFAKQLGFVNVLSASGTSAELLALIIKTAAPHKGILWHLPGREVKGDIVESLKIAGFEAKRQIVYEIEDVTELPSSLCSDLRNQKFSHVIFCSPRTTNIFVTLLKKLALEKSSCKMNALCLSQEIGKKASSLNWKKLWISPRPNMNDLMRYFNEER